VTENILSLSDLRKRERKTDLAEKNFEFELLLQKKKNERYKESEQKFPLAHLESVGLPQRELAPRMYLFEKSLLLSTRLLQK